MFHCWKVAELESIVEIQEAELQMLTKDLTAFESQLGMEETSVVEEMSGEKVQQVLKRSFKSIITRERTDN